MLLSSFGFRPNGRFVTICCATRHVFSFPVHGFLSFAGNIALKSQITTNRYNSHWQRGHDAPKVFCGMLHVQENVHHEIRDCLIVMDSRVAIFDYFKNRLIVTNNW